MKPKPDLVVALHTLLDDIDDGVEYPDAHCHVVIHFEYGEQSEFETCDITGLKGNCVAVTAFILV